MDLQQLRASHTAVIAADPEDLYNMVADITRTGQWSLACAGGQWDDGVGRRPGAWFTGRSGKTKTEVKDRLKAVHAEVDAGVRPRHGYTVATAVSDWLETGLHGRTQKTVEANRDSLRPLLASIGSMPPKELTAQHVRTALNKMSRTHATRTIQQAHNCLTRAIRQAEGGDLVSRNVSALVDSPRGSLVHIKEPVQ